MNPVGLYGLAPVELVWFNGSSLRGPIGSRGGPLEFWGGLGRRFEAALELCSGSPVSRLGLRGAIFHGKE